MAKRFPRSMKELRGKYPDGVIVQARFLTPKGSLIEWEGQAGAAFDQIHALVMSAFTETKP
jgi:hypothetical protein